MCMHALVCLWRSEDTLQELVLSVMLVSGLSADPCVSQVSEAVSESCTMSL